MQIDFLFWRVPDIPVLNISAMLLYALVIALLASRTLRAKLLPMLDMSTVQKGGYHFGALDVYRGLAALWITCAHTFNRTSTMFGEWTLDHFRGAIIGQGSKAVPVFCLLSGFLIYRSVMRIDSREAMRGYVRNRVLRIYPLYAVAVAAALALGFIPLTAPAILTEFFMLKSFSDVTQNALVNAWSLYGEVLFYAVIPTIAVLISSRPLLWAIVLTVVLFIFSEIGLRLSLIFPYFFIGIAASEVLDRYGKYFSEGTAIALFLAGTATFVVDIRWVGGYAPVLGYSAHGIGYTPALGIGFACMMIGSLTSRWISRLLSWKPLLVLGTVSYSIFIIHPFILYAAFPPVGLGENLAGRELLRQTLPVAHWWYLPVVTLPAFIFWSIVSFLLIERPFLLMRKRPKPAPPVERAAAT